MVDTSIQPAAEAVRAFAEASISPNTLRCYTGSIALYKRFCLDKGLPSDAPETVALWLSQGATHGFTPENPKRVQKPCKPSALARHLAGLSWWFTGRSVQPNPAKDPNVQRVLQGISRTSDTRPKEAKPILYNDIKAAYPQLNQRDRALVLVGWACGLRRSELVAIRVEHLRWEEQGLVIDVPKSKTGQKLVSIPYSENEVDPVKALKEYLQANDIKEGFVFRSYVKGGKLTAEGLSAETVNNLAKTIAKLLNKNPEEYSAHSLRSGFITDCAIANVPLQDIQRQSSHRSLQVLLRYIRKATLFQGHALNALLK